MWDLYGVSNTEIGNDCNRWALRIRVESAILEKMGFFQTLGLVFIEFTSGSRL